ncbi:MAG: class I SAM-dependent rRNA methyltransferase [Saprospiraceae bacterium]|nr:class I SAM-dependent rRNA methyltransferase [Saprospiraceae bacterium]
MPLPSVHIKRKRLEAIRRRHPWVFSGAIASRVNVEDGDLVRVLSPDGEFLAVGYFHDGSIAVRILSFKDRNIDLAFWRERIAVALGSRKRLGLPSRSNNAFRLIHGEGDGIPGLIIDIYDKTAVIQCHTKGIFLHISEIANALSEELDFIDAIYNKSAALLDDSEVEDGFIRGKSDEISILENGLSFMVDIESGQKTGFFLDQRDNRQLVGSLASGRHVLNLYAYTGGFSIYALKGEAAEVVSVDISKTAVEIMKQNVELNQCAECHVGLVKNVHQYLKEVQKDHFDMIILDPPAFAKSRRKRHNAVQAYKRINLAAMEKIRPGGLIFTFSCSQVVDAELFYNTITSAAIESGRRARVLYRLSQGADHPVSLFHPEGEYLKGLVVQIE